MNAFETAKAKDDKVMEQIEGKKARRELFMRFIRILEKQGALIEKIDEGFGVDCLPQMLEWGLWR